MDQEGAELEAEKTTPLFGAYRRGGYDPEQVDRYVTEQSRRLEHAEQRASEAERRLAAAVGQLRELHRRVAVLESEDRSPQPPSLDTLGERVQRILKEAWEGAYALRQAAEQEVVGLRERAASEAEEIVATAEERARQIDEEIDRRRKAYIARLEEDRSRAVAQVSYLHEQRRAALTELLRVKEIIEETVGDAAARALPAEARTPESVAPEPVVDVATAAPDLGDAAPIFAEAEYADEEDDDDFPVRPAEAGTAIVAGGGDVAPVVVRAPRARTEREMPIAHHEDAPTVAVRTLDSLVDEEDEADSAQLFAAPGHGLVRRLDEAEESAAAEPAAPAPGVFDFEEE